MRIQKLMCASLLLLLSQLCSAVEVQVSTYPECVQPGDTFYVKVIFINDSDENYNIVDESRSTFDVLDSNRFTLSRNGNIYRWLPEIKYYVEPGKITIANCVISKKSQFILLSLGFQFPSLEDLHSEFWEHEMEALKNSPEGLDYEFEVVVHRPRFESPQQTDPIWDEIFRKDTRTLDREEEKKRLAELWEKLQLRLKTKVKIKLRPPNEMTMIEQWYQNTPESFWPTNLRNTPSKVRYKEMGIVQWSAVLLGRAYKPPDSKWILIQEEWYSPWQFIRLGNRYPSDPNAPETWQGWKELEESISPSTMQDEIRLTRILIQYCDTKDAKVLEELKEWFAGMNEVQRACMANSLAGRGRDNEVLSVPVRDLINVVREYIISAKPVVEVK